MLRAPASWIVAGLLAGCGFACKAQETGENAGSSSPASAAPAKVDLVAVDREIHDARVLIRDELLRAKRDGRDLVVYVGAPWCEPCQRFHKAAASGALDSTFPKLRLLEFDHDRHESALAEAECRSKMIPLFARPTEDGRCSQARVEGAIKGDGAVPFIVPRLARIL